LPSKDGKPNKNDKKLPQGSPFRRGKGSDGDKKGGKGPRDPARAIIVWLVIILVVFVGLRYLQNLNSYRETQISYSQFKQLLANPETRIRKAVVIQKGMNRAVLHGEVGSEEALAELPTVEHTSGSRQFSVNLPFVDSEMLEEWDERGLQYTFESEKWNIWDVLLTMGPWIAFLLIWLFMIRQMQAGQRGIFSFGKSRAKVNSLDRPQNTFEDVAGVQEAKAELQEVIEFLKDPQKFKKLGGKIPKGVLLLGPPGTGKTLLARCVAGEAGVPFLSMSGSDFVEMFVGVGASRVRDLFETAKKNSPCLIFVDEVDAVGRQRGAGLGGGHDEREQTLNAMLVEMDGFEVNSGVILIAATNRPDVLDPALLRPGRFDRQVVVDAPDINGREGILKVHTKDLPLAPDVDLNTVARGTPGFVGADLANLVNEAALLAARFGQKNVTMIDFEEAKDKVYMGAERKSLVMSAEEKRNTAYHEAGHAICNVFCKHTDPLHKVTIIPRGRALGVTWALPKEDKYSQSKEYLLDKLCMALGGRAAEELVFNAKTTGAYNDIKEGTRLARRMICDFGMTDELGPLTYGEKNEQIFLGRELNQHRDYSEQTAQQIDGIMRSVVEEQYGRARKILTDHRDALDRLAKALIEFELLDSDEVAKVIKGEVLETARRTRTIPPLRKQENKATEPVTDGAAGNDTPERNTDEQHRSGGNGTAEAS
jgi:cell division protease FtsH